tara:strand:+ start:15416 stop:15550 length:135 start_codon:yes stop_codon:yes gene_type:complete
MCIRVITKGNWWNKTRRREFRDVPSILGGNPFIIEREFKKINEK